jgi:hypothetical protein
VNITRLLLPTLYGIPKLFGLGKLYMKEEMENQKKEKEETRLFQ